MSGVQAAVLGGSALILLVAVLRIFLKNRLPRRLFPALWCIAALRLLIPAAIPSRLSVWNLLGTSSAPGAVSEQLSPFPAWAGETAVQAAHSVQVRPVFLIWLLGAALLAAYFGIGYGCMVRRLHGMPMTPPCLRELLPRFRMTRTPRICVSASRHAPLTYGVFRPTVLLPESLPAGEEQLRLVLAHELAHVRRRDCLRKLLLAVCLCVYWWNPLVWIMTVLANRDMELACDEAVLCALGPACKKAYALALLDLAENKAGAAPLCSGFARSSAEERIRAILKFRPIPAWMGICAAALFLLTACVVSTQAVSRTPVPEPAVQETPVRQTVRAEPAAVPEVQAPEPQVEAPAYIWPLEDTGAAVTDPYGWKANETTGKEALHPGVDLAASDGANVLAVADGTVVDCSYDMVYGYVLTLEHPDGLRTQYAHLRAFLVNAGDTVRQGQIIAQAGASGWTTGPHLHLGAFINGEAVDPLTTLGQP